MSWYVRNVREAQWQANELGAFVSFGAEELGVNLISLEPGQPMTMYHREQLQEGFLVLRGACLLVVEGEEVPLKQWDYFHCPAGVNHAIVGAGAGRSLVFAVGNRVGDNDVVYPRDETALKHDAGVEQETTRPSQAYARFSPDADVEFREALLG